MEEVKGFNDYTGEEALRREKIKDILIKNFKLYGFEPVETPIIEDEKFVIGENKQDEVISDIFKLQDKGKRKLALRYEFTFQLKRLAKNKKLPYKRYQIGEVFRDEPLKKNRVRQITQADVDVVGSDVKNEAEILSLVSKILKELGIKAEINVNNRKLLNEILEKEEIENREQVIREIDKLDKLPEIEVRRNLKKLKAEKILSVIKSREKCKEYKAYAEILELEKKCKKYGVKINFQSSLARGLSYYNGSVFEVKIKGMKETVCAGGSYLVNNIPATGISFGVERLSSLAKIKIENKKVLIISVGQDEKAIKLAEKLRSFGINIEIMYGKISKSLQYANSKNIEKVIFLGKEEVKKKKLKLRDMKTGKEEMLREKSLVENLRS